MEDLFSAARNGDEIPEFSVSEISFEIKRFVEAAFSRVRIKGEIFGAKRADSGHWYLTLKDDNAALAAVIWRGTAATLSVKPEDGLEVVATGKITTFAGKSSYQLIIETLEVAGAGALLKLLEERKKAFAAEGLFDAAHKKPLPFLPRSIGVVTSASGAVIRDIIHRVRDRFPSHILLIPTPVQGEGAAEKIAQAIKDFNRLDEISGYAKPDVLIVARGGGSLEDLWPFNEECVIRAVYASQIPIISAVGHETDFSILDFASDLRAPTPSVAGELATFNYYEELQYLEDIKQSLEKRMHEKLEKSKTKVVTLSQFALRDINNYLKTSQSELIMLKNSIILKIEKLIDNRKANLNYLSAKLEKSNPLAILKSGYAKVMVGGQSAKAKNLKEGDRLTTYLIDGEVVSIVESVKEKK